MMQSQDREQSIMASIDTRDSARKRKPWCDAAPNNLPVVCAASRVCALPPSREYCGRSM